MKKSDFIKLEDEYIKKSEIIEYWPTKTNKVMFYVKERGDYTYTGTLEQFEAELFNEVEQALDIGPQFYETGVYRDGMLTALRWVLKEMECGFTDCDIIGAAIARLEKEGEL